MASRLLVVDDSPTIRKLVEISCRALPFTLEFATSGADGLARAKASPPDIVLLDLVLPDMKGLEVWEQLSRDPRTSQSAVLLMSAKDESQVRAQLGGRAVGFLKKPFAAKDLAQKLEHAQGQGRAPAKRSELPFEDKQRLAKLIYARLKGTLGLIPDWLPQLGTAEPANFFARRILTPELIDELVHALREELGTGTGTATSAGQAGAPSGRPLAGTVDGFPTLELLRAVSGHGGTGVLELAHAGRRVWLSWRRGALLMATTDAVDEYLKGSDVDLSSVPAEDRTRAEAEQARSGKPVFVSLAEAGRLPTAQLARLLYVQGKRVLMEALDEPKLAFAWSEASSLPLYVEAQGREIALSQILLERLRRDGSAMLEQGSDSLQWVYERVPGFSRRVRQLDLLPDERRVLTLIDGRHPVARVIRRASMGPAQVAAVVSRLAGVELIRRVEARSSGRRRVVLIEPDDAGVRAPLELLLSRRREPLELVTLSTSEPQLATQVVRQWPALVIANATALGEAALELAQALVGSPQGLETALVATLEERDPELADHLLAAGFDAVLPKPVWFGDLECLLKG